MGSEGLPRISRFEVFRSRKEILKNPLPFHRRHFEKLGDTFRVSVISGSDIIFTRDPALIRHVLQKNHRNFRKSDLQTKELAKYIGHGLLTSEGEHWRKHRRLIQPAFHKNRLKELLQTMDRVVAEELKDLQLGDPIDIYPLMSDLAFQVVAQSLFSRKNIRERMHRLQKLTEDNQRMLIREMRQPYLKWWFRLSGQLKRHQDYAKEGRDILNTIIDERINSDAEKNDLMDMLLSARYEDGSPMSREQLIDEVLILFTAGHETTANALSFVLFLLARHPDIQDSLYKETMQAMELGSPQELIQGSPLAKQCIEEAMRLYPPVYVIDRVAREEETFEGIHLKKGALVLLSIYELHRSEHLWKSPDKFQPSRFEAGTGKTHASYYFPFGAGPRMCIGNNFAMYEMILVLSRMVRKYEIRSATEMLELNPLISLKPGSVRLQFHRR